MSRQLHGVVRSFVNYFFKIDCPDAEPAFRTHYLRPYQARSARVGDCVILEYRSVASIGEWVVKEVLS
jgi:hypothetical protein